MKLKLPDKNRVGRPRTNWLIGTAERVWGELKETECHLPGNRHGSQGKSQKRSNKKDNDGKSNNEET